MVEVQYSAWGHLKRDYIRQISTHNYSEKIKFGVHLTVMQKERKHNFTFESVPVVSSCRARVGCNSVN